MKNTTIKKMKTFEKITYAIALSSVALVFPFCTIILHQPKIPKKLARAINKGGIDCEIENCNM